MVRVLAVFKPAPAYATGPRSPSLRAYLGTIDARTRAFEVLGPILALISIIGAFVSVLPSLYTPSQFAASSAPAVIISWAAVMATWLGIVWRARGSSARSWALPSRLFRVGMTFGPVALLITNALGAALVPDQRPEGRGIASLVEALSYEFGIVALASLAAFAASRSILRPVLVTSQPPTSARDLTLRTRFLVSAAASSFATAGVLLAVLIDFQDTPTASLIGFAAIAILLVAFTTAIGWLVGDDAARAMESLTRKVRELAARTSTAETRVPVMSADEIGDLATALQSLEQRVRRDEATAAAASERERIARELHDGAAKSVSALALEAASLRARGDASVAHDLMRIEKLARDLSDELRAIVRDLRSREDTQPFAEVLRECIVPHRGARLDVEPGIEAASPLVRYQVTRILSEALRNAEMHAQGSQVAVDVAANSDRLHVRVDDDGVGIERVDWEQLVDDGHFGLMGMRERAQLLGGTLDVERSGMGGLRILVDVPLRVTQ